MKKAILFMASPRKKGNTAALLAEVARGARDAGAETKVYNLNEMKITPCQACMQCRKAYGCPQKDDMQQVYADMKDACGVALGSPVYMWGVTAQAKLLMDRLFPMLGPDYAPRLGKKRALCVYSQGNPDPQRFTGTKPDSTSSCFKDTGNWFKFLGMEPVRGELVASGANSPDTAARDQKLMTEAYESGKMLVKENE
jgi:multimeric flavodoxin WrbA